MTDEYLQVAKRFILDEDYNSARKILSKIPNNITAQKWLAQMALSDFAW